MMVGFLFGYAASSISPYSLAARMVIAVGLARSWQAIVVAPAMAFPNPW